MSGKKSNRSDTAPLRFIPAKGFKRAYEFRAADETLGRIRWTKLFGSLAEAEFGARRWTFKRGGFIRPRVTVREARSDAELAVLELYWGGGGLLRMGSGARFTWQRSSFWSRRFASVDGAGAELVGFEPKFGLMRRTCAVSVHAGASKTRELGLLEMLGWYVVLMIADDEAAAAATCCS